MINLYPKTCNLCGGIVIYASNAIVYHGHRYGSGYCYYCTQCGAYVGTHNPRPREALGILADDSMRRAKMLCHEIFDVLWKGKKHASRKRSAAYGELAKRLGVPLAECHFGYFDLPMLRKAYKAVRAIQRERGIAL